MTSAPTGSKNGNLPDAGHARRSQPNTQPTLPSAGCCSWMCCGSGAMPIASMPQQTAPNVLEFKCELLVDGRKLERPVNYGLVRIVPPAGVEIRQTARPFVIFDPRAGHGPGIGGFKADSEIGMAMRAGHPCYFVGFLPEPMPGQTIEDISRAEAVFLDEVIKRHPQADGKPCVIGNCQAGWAVMMLAAIRPGIVRTDHHRGLAACPTGTACAANIRCAIAADCSAEAG